MGAFFLFLGKAVDVMSGISTQMPSPEVQGKLSDSPSIGRLIGV